MWMAAGTCIELKDTLAMGILSGYRVLDCSIAMAGPFAAFVYLGPITTQSMGLDAGLLPFVMLAFGVGAAIGNTLGGQLSDRVGANRTVVIAMVANVIALLVISAIPVVVPAGLIGPVYFGFMFVWGIAGWMFPPAQVSRIVALAPNSAPLALSLNASCLYLGTALGAVVGGQVIEHIALGELGLIAAAFPLLALAVFAASNRAPAPMPRLG